MLPNVTGLDKEFDYRVPESSELRVGDVVRVDLHGRRVGGWVVALDPPDALPVDELKPIIKVLGCLFYLVTLWLIAFVVNALLFLLVSWLAGLLHLPFHVQGFWSAFWGAIIVSVVSWAITVVLPDSDSRVRW